MPPHSAYRWKIWLALGAIAVATLAVYCNTFSAPFIFDDEATISGNPSIRNFWSLGEVLFPPHTVFSAGRPFLNLSFAFNYAMGGLSVEGYHVLNLLIHILAAVALFGIVRITLSLPRLKESHGDRALVLALAVATLWALHPIQTESVTYVSQRAESLMGLLYLLSLYFFIRSALSPAPRLWASLSVVACALGMMTKEVMVSAPLVALLYDRTFISGSFREAWRRRWRTYLSLGATWLVLAALMVNGSLEQRDVGYEAGLTGWAYALIESKVVVGYLGLALWPHPLVFDYGLMTLGPLIGVAPHLFILVLLLAVTLLALRRWPSLGFLGAWFFLILIPTSSIVPIAGQPMSENRMYLPLASVIVLGVIGLHALVGRKGLFIVFPILAIALGILAARRNSDYRDAIAIWSDTVLKQPENARAQNNLGNALAAVPDRIPDSIGHFEAALRLYPDYAEAHNNLGIALAKTPGRLEDSIVQFETALKIKPRYAEAHFNLGSVLLAAGGHTEEAWAQFDAALRLRPDLEPAIASLRSAQP